jgi:hypothetical protein
MAGKRYYIDGDPDTEVTPSQLKRMASWRQREYVRQWFNRNFEDPVMQTPRDDGEYQYIWGGPYDAREQLWAEFEGILPEGRIEDIADEIERRGTEWAPGPDHPDYPAGFDDSDELPEDDGEPDFQPIIESLERGATPSYGSEFEQRERHELLGRIARLEEELAQVRPVYGGIGHNRPPKDGEKLARTELLELISEAAAAIKTELTKEKPHALAVARSASGLQKVGRWLAGKADAATDSFAKAIGAAGAVAVAASLSGLSGPLGDVIHAAATWLQWVLWGF